MDEPIEIADKLDAKPPVPILYDLDTRDISAALRSLRAENERLRESLRNIEQGDIPRPIGKAWNPEKPGKNDRCIHDRWMYDDCGECISAYARAAITPSP